jgi:hypothetical protein
MCFPKKVNALPGRENGPGDKRSWQYFTDCLPSLRATRAVTV